MTTPSETPRVDAEAYNDDGRHYLEHSVTGRCVSADFARTLERELRALTTPVERVEIDGLVKDAEHIQASLLDHGIKCLEAKLLPQRIKAALETMARERDLIMSAAQEGANWMELWRKRAEKAEARLSAIDKAVGMVEEPKRWYWFGKLCHYVNGVLIEQMEHDSIRSDPSPPVVLLADYDAHTQKLAADLKAANERAARMREALNKIAYRGEYNERQLIDIARTAITGESNG